MSRVAVEVSDDGFERDVRRAAEADLPVSAGVCAIGLCDVGAGRWWRLVALSETRKAGAPWAVAQFDLSPHPLPDWHEGRALAGSFAEAGVAPRCAFDAGESMPWVSLESGADVKGTAWIGWDYGPNKRVAVTGVEVTQWDAGGKPNTVSAALVQCSDDGFAEDIATVKKLALGSGTATRRFSVEGGHAARYWRILADAATGGGHWGIDWLAFRTDADANADGKDVGDKAARERESATA